MFSCPNKDIHSIYIDNELPKEFIPKYEEHIKNCPKCAKELAKLKKVRAIFLEDSATLNVDHVFIDQSFERLQSRMRYTKVVSQAQDKNTFNFASKLAPFATAAAVFAFAILLPMNLANKNTSKSENDFMPVIKSQTARPIAYRNIVVDGNLPQVPINQLGTDTKKKEITIANNIANYDSNSHLRSTLTSVDIFRPDFSSNTIKISIPEMADLHPLVADIITSDGSSK